MTFKSVLLSTSAFLLIAPAFADHRENERNWLPRFRGMDRNGDQAISFREWRGNRQAFNQHDWNRDGFIAGEELTRENSLDRTHRGSADRVEPIDRRDEQFQEMDRNGDGMIQAHEWTGNRAVFRRLDRDGNSRITYAEFTERGRGTGSLSSQFSHMDTNRNGVIDGNEWRDDPQVFHAMDTNHNSVLDYDEFVNGREDQTGSADRQYEDDGYFNRRRR